MQHQHYCFNPLDRGNLYQIFIHYDFEADDAVIAFQSPRSGKFVSDHNLNKVMLSHNNVKVSIP